MVRMVAALFVSVSFCTAGFGQDMALSFDGSRTIAVIPSPMDQSGAFTVEAWVKIRTENGGRVLCNRGGSTGYELFVSSSGLTIAAGVNGSWNVSGDYPGLDEWFHLAWSFSGPDDHTSLLYVNGQLVGTYLEDSFPEPSNFNMTLGAFPAGNAVLDGVVDDLHIWSKALDAATILAWKDRTLTQAHPDYAFLEGAWDFNEGTGQTAASLVNSPALDIQLGTTPAGDENDPAWVPGRSVVPVLSVTFGDVKRAFLPQE